MSPDQWFFIHLLSVYNSFFKKHFHDHVEQSNYYCPCYTILHFSLLSPSHPYLNNYIIEYKLCRHKGISSFLNTVPPLICSQKALPKYCVGRIEGIQAVVTIPEITGIAHDSHTFPPYLRRGWHLLTMPGPDRNLREPSHPDQVRRGQGYHTSQRRPCFKNYKRKNDLRDNTLGDRGHIAKPKGNTIPPYPKMFLRAALWEWSGSVLPLTCLLSPPLQKFPPSMSWRMPLPRTLHSVSPPELPPALSLPKWV